jgi:two-component system alkaline phosphatase synthesis response regulator PhoP
MAADKVMVVDDDQNIRLVLKYRLEKEGYDVLLAGDGVDALEKVKAEKPDLIILDLTMPRMDGFGFLEEIKGNNGRANAVPVIVLTAYGYESNRARSLELGAVEFMAKPFSPRQSEFQTTSLNKNKEEKR